MVGVVRLLVAISMLMDDAGRLLKHLATAVIVKEVGVDTFVATPTSDVLSTPEGSGPVVNWSVLIAARMSMTLVR